jgi:hypothetical protein
MKRQRTQPKPRAAAPLAEWNGRVGGIQLASELRTLKGGALWFGGMDQAKELLGGQVSVLLTCRPS